MEERDLKLIKAHLDEDADLKRLYDEHLLFERQIEELERHFPQTLDSQYEIEKIKKLKLKGKDLIERILVKYR